MSNDALQFLLLHLIWITKLTKGRPEVEKLAHLCPNHKSFVFLEVSSPSIHVWQHFSHQKKNEMSTEDIDGCVFFF